MRDDPPKPAATFDPRLPWGGVRGSPCGDSAGISFVDLADCQECPMCGGCLTHWPCRTDPAHLEWFLQFAAFGEAICGTEENPSSWPGFVCELPQGHDDDLHRDLKGNAWGVSRPRSR